MYEGDTRSPCGEGALPSSGTAAGGSSSVGTAKPVGSDDLVVAGGPIGPCETLSPLFS